MPSRSPSTTARSSQRPSAPAGQVRKKKPGIAALAPLAVGLASGLLPSSHPPAAPVTAPTTVVSSALVSGRMFNPGCPLPFAGKLNPDADDTCGIQGGSSDPGKQAESRAKNDFCVSTASPQLVTHQFLIELQTKSTAAKLPKDMPNRDTVTAMGEGKYVSYIAFVKNAHYSDVSKGEAVNCNEQGNTHNDIHIVLVENPSDVECLSTTAEMSPHFRPPAWTPDSINSAQGHPVRVHGPLFYDGSHSPCTATSSPSPQRASLWEIHPVYSFDVCRNTDIAKCQDGDATVWVPLDQWVSSEGQ